MKIANMTLTVDSLSKPQQVDPIDSQQTLLLVFAATDIDPVVFDGLQQRFPLSKKIGCSTAGHIIGDSIVDDEVVVGAIQFETTNIVIVSENIQRPEDSYKAGKGLAEQLPHDALKAIFMVSDGLLVNGSELVNGVNSVIDKEIPVTGGLAGDADRFKKTWVLCDSKPQSGKITAVGLYGPHLKVSHGSAGGWDKFGVTRTVTRAEGNILYSLDDQPALTLYKEYLGERAQGLPSTGLLFPLSVYTDDDESGYVVRTILAVDEASNSLTFAGDIPQGARVQLMRANFDRLIDGAHQSASQLGFDPEFSSGLAIAISCVGRRLVLGERTEEELEATLDKLPEGTKQIGFYSYGEISPCTDGRCDLHNQTMTLTLLTESR